jgi:hypothetical protein
MKLFLNGNPSSPRYGVALQISALRDLSKESNIDQIPDFACNIYFPTSSLLQLTSRSPLSQNSQMSEEESQEVERTFRLFWVEGEAEMRDLRHVMVKCSHALLDEGNIPKLRSQALDCDLARILSTVRTANEIPDAWLELDLLVPAWGGETSRAVKNMREAAERDSEVRDMWRGERFGRKSCSVGGLNSLSLSSGVVVDENLMKENKSRECTPKKQFIPAIIDGKFVSPGKTPLFQNENQPPTKAADNTTKNVDTSTAKKSPQKYLHPHSFDSEKPHKSSNNNLENQTPSLIKATKAPSSIDSEYK